MNKASLCFAGLVTLLFSPSAFALTPTADWHSQNQAVIQTIPTQGIPSGAFLDDSAGNEIANRSVNSLENGLRSNRWIDQMPSNSANLRPGTSTAVEPDLDRQPLQPSLPPAFTEATAPAASDRTEPGGESAQPFGATPIQSQLGVEFDLSNSARPLPSPAAPSVQSPRPPAPVVQSSSAAAEPPVAEPTVAEPTVNPSNKPEFTLKDLFKGDSDSMVAVTVGNAEGTRQPNGQPNKAFYGHTDPGNGVWNLGTFSFQHGADSPEAADVKQLNRLKKQANVMQQKAADHGLKLTLEETLNGIDLANQAPQAVIDRQGYVEWLAKAYAQGLKGADAILWARVHSFIDPETQQWNAPGLGNTPERITHDQQRRMEAIASALGAQDYAISPDARLRPQPIAFRIPGLIGMVRQVASNAVQWFGF